MGLVGLESHNAEERRLVSRLAERGHRVTLFDAADEIGGQFNLAKRIPGKEEFHETLRYFTGHDLHRRPESIPRILRAAMADALTDPHITRLAR